MRRRDAHGGVRGDVIRRPVFRPVLTFSVAAMLAAGASVVSAKGVAPSAPLTAEQIVDKNVAARGGLDAWRNVGSMVWMGHLESADPNMPRLTFVLEQKRPNKERFELSEIGQKSMRVFDGKYGWRVKPNRDGSLDAQPYTPQDLEFARQAQGIDGPLLDYKAKGVTLESVSIEKIDGRRAYRLHVKSPGGELRDVWIDAKTFLDVKYDRTSYRANGDPGIVSVVYRDYKVVEGLQIPSILEIGGGGDRPPAKMVIEKVALNPPLDDKVFTKPNAAHRSRMATVDMTQPAADPRQAFGPLGPPGIGRPGPGSSQP